MRPVVDVRRMRFDQTLYYNVNGWPIFNAGGSNDVGSDDIFTDYLLGLPASYSQGSAQAERVRVLVEDRRRLERELAEAKKNLALGGGTGGGRAQKDRVRTVSGLSFLGDVVEGIAPGDMRGLIDAAKKEIGSGVVAFVGVNEGKAALLVGVTDDLKGRISAVDLVKPGVEALGGKGGGGRPDMAQGGGPDASKAKEALEAVDRALRAIV